MATKRKDSKGRVLKDGESQRSDNRYQYRYTGLDGKRHTVYGKTLDELREKETEIQRDLSDGINNTGGNITVLELVQRHIARKRGLAPSTEEGYRSFLRLLENNPLGNRLVSSVTVSDAKDWMIQQADEGKAIGTISGYKSKLLAAFDDAVNDYLIRRNPFSFTLDNVVKDTTPREKRTALTSEQQRLWMEFISTDSYFQKYRDWFLVLFGTGIRIGEFCGLTLKDLDFEQKRIRIERQVWRDSKGVIHIRKPKTDAGRRFIPMTAEVEATLRNMIASRNPHHETIVEGCTQFLACQKSGRPRWPQLIEEMFRRAVAKFRQQNPNEPLFQLTPHVCRHTFATRMVEAGMDVKSLQYILGHTDVALTLGIYAHSSYEAAAKQMEKLNNAQENAAPKAAEI